MGLDGSIRCPGVRSSAEGRTERCGNALPEGSKLCHTCSGYRRGVVALVTDKPKEVRKVLGNYSNRVPDTISPIQVLLNLIQEAVGNVEFYRQEVGELERLFVPGKSTRQELQIAVSQYDAERDRLQKYVSDALRIGLEQRQVKLYELQARTIAEIIKRVIDTLDLTSEQRHLALSTAAEELRTFAQRGNAA
jgi:hypothetical protein